MEEVRYMISEASKRVNVESHVLRHWQKELALPISRNEMDQRYYKESDIELLKKVKHLKDQGFQLKAIKMLLMNMSDSAASVTELMRKEGQEDKVIDFMKEDRLPKEGKLPMEDKLPKEDKFPKDGKLPKEGKLPMEDKLPGEDKFPREDTIPLGGTSLIPEEKNNGLKEVEMESKMGQFKTLMNHIVLNALKENNMELSNEISMNVSEGIIREMNYLMRLKEEKEEERFKRLDATIRDYQKSRSMAAATFEKDKRKSKFFKKNRVYI